MTRPSFICYIDESGCEGFKFDKGSSRWFVLSAVFVKMTDEPSFVGCAKYVKTEIGKPVKKPLHWKDLKHDHKVFWASEIAELDIRCLAVAVNKEELLEPEQFQGGWRLYFYATRYLLERVSWLARDTPTGGFGNGKADIVFSNRSSMSYDKLDSYLETLKTQRSGGFDVRIEFDYIGARTSLTPGKRVGLQIADAYAGAVFNALERNRFGFVETRYLDIFKRVIYMKDGRVLGYGFKIWPREAIEGFKETEAYAVIGDVIGE